MISGAAFCPQAPLLVPGVGTGAGAAGEAVRAACRAAVSRAAAGRQLVLVGDGPVPRVHAPGTRGSLARFGVPLEVALGPAGDGPPVLPPSLTVGAWLVRDALGPDAAALAVEVAPGFAGSPAAATLLELAETRDLGLVVLGDGSAQRGDAHLDPRAAPFDEAVAATLAGGDGAQLAEIDGALGAALGASGVPAWHAAAALLEGGRYAAEVLYDDAPFGVGYFVACWTAPPTGRGPRD